MIYLLIAGELALGIAGVVSINKRKKQFDKYFVLLMCSMLPYVIIPVLGIAGLIFRLSQLVIMPVSLPFAFVFPLMLVAVVSGLKKATCIGYESLNSNESLKGYEYAILRVDVNGETKELRMQPMPKEKTEKKYKIGDEVWVHSPLGNPSALGPASTQFKVLILMFFVSFIDVLVAIAMHTSIWVSGLN